MARTGAAAAGRTRANGPVRGAVLLACAAGLGLGSCASHNPGLVGRWSIDSIFPLVGPMTETWLLRDDGTADWSTTAASCTGTLTYTNIAWSSTATQISFSGTPGCTGGVMCTMGGASVNFRCGEMTAPQAGTGDYELAADRSTLRLGMRTFNRVE